LFTIAVCASTDFLFAFDHSVSDGSEKRQTSPLLLRYENSLFETSLLTAVATPSGPVSAVFSPRLQFRDVLPSTGMHLYLTIRAWRSKLCRAAISTHPYKYYVFDSSHCDDR